MKRGPRIWQWILLTSLLKKKYQEHDSEFQAQLTGRETLVDVLAYMYWTFMKIKNNPVAFGNENQLSNSTV